MYRIDDQKIIESFIRENGFATLISGLDPYPIATHIPLDLQVNEDGEKVLWGHVSKGNTQWKKFEQNPNVLAVFMSNIHSYISSSWYKHPNAPTWNYMSVHVTGKVSFLKGEKLWNSVSKLTDKYEKDSESPVSLKALPTSVQRMMKGLVGFEIRINSIECAFKLSQNRNKEDLQSIISQLRARRDPTSNIMADVIHEKIFLQKNNN